MMMLLEMRTVDKLSTQPTQVGFFMYYKRVLRAVNERTDFKTPRNINERVVASSVRPRDGESTTESGNVASMCRG
jgi:hypothetical protein